MVNNGEFQILCQLILQELQSQVEVILELNNKVAALSKERDSAVLKADSVQKNWREEEMRIRREMDAQNEKLQEVLKQNEVLLDKIQELSSDMAVSQRQVTFIPRFFFISMVTFTKCISDIFRENELNTRIGAHTCRLSATIHKRAKWFIISLQGQHTNISSP